jgi:hypothetical protein
VCERKYGTTGEEEESNSVIAPEMPLRGSDSRSTLWRLSSVRRRILALLSPDSLPFSPTLFLPEAPGRTPALMNGREGKEGEESLKWSRLSSFCIYSIRIKAPQESATR